MPYMYDDDFIGTRKHLEDAGIESVRAEALTAVIAETARHTASRVAATRDDIEALRTETKAGLETLRTETRAGLEALRTETRADIDRSINTLRSEMRWHLALIVAVIIAAAAPMLLSSG